MRDLASLVTLSTPCWPDLIYRLIFAVTQAKRAAVRMRQMMAERGWMPANDANDLVADAEEGAVLQVLKQADQGERMHGIQFLAHQNMLHHH